MKKWLISLCLFPFLVSASPNDEPYDVVDISVAVKKFLKASYEPPGIKSSLVYDVYPAINYGTYVMQCASVRDPKNPQSGRIYYLFLVQNKEFQWIYPLGFIDDEVSNDRHYYLECSNKMILNIKPDEE